MFARLRRWFSGGVKALRARFDLAQTTADNRNHWANADGNSARAALTPSVRKMHRERSRYEAENNSWYAGILSTATNHIVGTGPRLQVATADAAGNSRLERAWRQWSRKVGLTSKLRVMFETYWRDGEAFLLRGTRPVLWPISLDLRVYESEQVQNPYTAPSLGDPYVDDGIRFLPNSSELEYFFLDHHPTDPVFAPTWKGEWKPASEVVHLFRPVRPGQIRGIPRATPGLPLLAIMRRYELATVHAAETAANHALFMQYTGTAVAPAASPADFAELEIARNMMTILPEGWEMNQLRPEQPATTLPMFTTALLMHFCRCMNIPYGLAAGTAKDSNFSSHKGDIRNLWQSEVWAEQELLERTVLDVVFRWFLEDALLVPGLLDGLPPFDQIEHQWFWDGIPPLDETDAATAATIRLKAGLSTLDMEYARNGYDFATAMAKGDAAFDLPPGTYQQAVFASLFPQPQAAPAAGQRPGKFSQPAATPTGEYTQLGQRAFANNLKRIRATLEEVSAGTMSEAVARVTLQTIGLDPSRIDSLLADVSDGQINAPELAEATP